MKKNFQKIKEKLILHKLVNFNNFMIKKQNANETNT